MEMMVLQELTDDKVLLLNNGHLVADGLKPSKFIIDEQEFSVGSWTDILVTSLNFIEENDKNLFSNLTNDRVIFKYDTSDFVAPVALKNGIKIETGFDDQDTFDKIKAILQSTRWDYQIQIAL